LLLRRTTIYRIASLVREKSITPRGRRALFSNNVRKYSIMRYMFPGISPVFRLLSIKHVIIAYFRLPTERRDRYACDSELLKYKTKKDNDGTKCVRFLPFYRDNTIIITYVPNAIQTRGQCRDRSFLGGSKATEILALQFVYKMLTLSYLCHSAPLSSTNSQYNFRSCFTYHIRTDDIQIVSAKNQQLLKTIRINVTY